MSPTLAAAIDAYIKNCGYVVNPSAQVPLGVSGNIVWTGTFNLTGGGYSYRKSWDKYTVACKVKDALEYVEMLEAGQARLKDIIQG